MKLDARTKGEKLSLETWEDRLSLEKPTVMTGLTDYSDWLWLLAFNGTHFRCITGGFHARTGHILTVPMGIMPGQRISLHHDATLTKQGTEIIVGSMEWPIPT